MPDPAPAVTATVVHFLPGRIRLRFRGMAAADLATLREQIASLPGVTEVRADSRTGSMLILGDAVSYGALEAASRRAGHALERAEEARPLIDHLSNRLEAADQRLRQASGGGLDIASVAVLVLLGTAVIQMARGRIAGPAITILWYAASTVLMARSLRNR